MMDADSFINNTNSNDNYNEEIFKVCLEEINNNINNLNSQIDEWNNEKKIGKFDIILTICSVGASVLINLLAGIGGIGWLIVYKKYIVPYIIKSLKKDLKCEQKKRKQEIERYEKFEEKRKEMLKDDKDYKKIRKNLLEKIDNLDKDELLTIRMLVTEYTTNRDIPSQVGNIAQFLTETQVGDIDIKDTALYNKQVDDEAKGKGKAKIYYINGQKLD